MGRVGAGEREGHATCMMRRLIPVTALPGRLPSPEPLEPGATAAMEDTRYSAVREGMVGSEQVSSVGIPWFVTRMRSLNASAACDKSNMNMEVNEKNDRAAGKGAVDSQRRESFLMREERKVH